MTFTEIVNAAAGRLNLTSAEALARLGGFVNERYRRLTSSTGLNTSRRATVSAVTTASNPRLTLGLEKLETVYVTDGGVRRVVRQITYDEWRNRTVWTPRAGDVWEYAEETTGPSSVTIVLHPTPAAAVTVSADGLANASTLSGTDVPNFPADFHDALVFGAVADELEKLERPKQANQFEGRYESRVADLRYFLAKSATLSLRQGGARPRLLGRHFLDEWR